MFLLRLKTEFAENLKLVLALWITLGVIVWSFFDWWHGPLAEQRNQGALGAFAILAAGIILFFLIATMLKRDDLKHPQEFWATRPIRAWTLFVTKFTFAFLVIVFPVGLLTTAIGLVVGVGFPAVLHGLELMLWLGFATSLLALSSMAYPGGNRALLAAGCFFGSVILTCVILSNRPAESLLRPHWVDDSQMQWNLLAVLLLLTAWLIWQCLRQIRDKHRRQRLPVLIATGILTVLLVALVPLPGGIPTMANKTAATTLPTVTKAKVSGSNMQFGHWDQTRFVSVEIELIPDEGIVAEAVEFAGKDFRITGPHDVPQQVEDVYVGHVDRGGLDGLIEAKPTLRYFVFERHPSTRRSASSGSDHAKSEIVASLPRKKIRIAGRMTLNGIQYRTIHRSALTQPFAIKESGMRIAFINSPDRHTGHESSVIWKAYMPPLVTSLSRYRQDMVRFRLEHPASRGLDWYDRLEGGGSGGGAFFGPYRERELRISDREIESNFFWQKLKERGYDKSVQEWKQEAELVCEVVDEVHPLVLPVDIEVEVPDPELVRDLMLKGEL